MKILSLAFLAAMPFAGHAFATALHDAPDPVACLIAEDAPTDANLAACHGVPTDDILAFTFMGEPALRASRDIAPNSWSAGFEEAYIRMCGIDPDQRASWASPVTTTIADRSAFADGYDAALESVADYENRGFDAIEWCGDNHP